MKHSESITTIEHQRFAAMLSADVVTLDRLLSDGLIYVHANADIDNKESYLQRIASGSLRYLELDQEIIASVDLEGVVLISGRFAAKVDVAGEMRTIDNLYLAVWAPETSGWRLVAYQPTAVAERR